MTGSGWNFKLKHESRCPWVKADEHPLILQYAIELYTFNIKSFGMIFVDIQAGT